MTLLKCRFLRLWRDETGDVPGWVLITLMTAGLATPYLNRVIHE